MQSLRSRRVGRTTGSEFTGAMLRRSDVRWGFAGLVAVVVLVVAVGLVSVVKIGEHTYSARMSDAAAVRVGDEVRVAGVTVGKVTSLELRSDHVDLAFTVRDEVFVGDRSSLDVRMLTVVGGHYLALAPAGDRPLGHTPIPPDRVTLPYSLPELFRDAIKPVQEVDGNILRENFAALQKSIGSSPQSFGTLVTAVSNIVDILNKQNADISQTLSLADEYLTALNANKQLFARLVRAFNTLETLVADNKLAVGASLRDLQAVVTGLAPLGRQWDSTLKPMAQPLADTIPKLDRLFDHLGTLLDSVRGLGEQLRRFVTPQGDIAVDQSAAVLQSQAPCIPVPGRTC